MAKSPDDSSPRSTGSEAPPSDAPPLVKVSRHVQPLGPRVLVRIVRSPDRSEAGLFLPQGVKDEKAMALLGEVIEVARTLPHAESMVVEDDNDNESDALDLGQNVSGIPLGANVLFEKDRGVTLPWDENLRIIEVRHVLAIVDIIGQDEIQ